MLRQFEVGDLLNLLHHRLCLLALVLWLPMGDSQFPMGDSQFPMGDSQFSTKPAVSHPDPADPCHQDNLLCEFPTPPKLDVFFEGRRIGCNEFVSRDDAIHAPQVHYIHVQTNVHFLLIMIDPDAPYPCAPPDVTMEHILHYVTVVRLMNNRLISIHDTLNYHPPAPPEGIHRYQFYLYPWEDSRIPDLDYNSPSNRAGFNRTVFQSANHLGEPVAVFQFRSQHHVSLYLHTFILVACFLVFEAAVGFIGNVVFVI